jgi:hypothetical protein
LQENIDWWETNTPLCNKSHHSGCEIRFSLAKKFVKETAKENPRRDPTVKVHSPGLPNVRGSQNRSKSNLYRTSHPLVHHQQARGGGKDLASAQVELEGLTAVQARVKLGAVGQEAAAARVSWAMGQLRPQSKGRQSFAAACRC